MQLRAVSATATDTVFCGVPAVKNFHPFGGDSFRLRVRESPGSSRSPVQRAKVNLPEKDKERKTLFISKFFNKMNFTAVDKQVGLCLQHQPCHLPSRAQSASLQRDVHLGRRSASHRMPAKYHNLHLMSQRPNHHHGLQDLLVISRMNQQSRKSDDPVLGDSSEARNWANLLQTTQDGSWSPKDAPSSERHTGLFQLYAFQILSCIQGLPCSQRNLTCKDVRSFLSKWVGHEVLEASDFLLRSIWLLR